MGLRENLASINKRIRDACTRAGREISEITLVAVSKTVPTVRIREAIQCGVRVLGENRIQEAVAKVTELKAVTVEAKTEWHLIGHLQSNKASRAVEIFDAIHSIDSLKLAHRVAQIAGEMGKRLPVFLEVNLGGEESKSGLPTTEVLRLIEQIGKLDRLELKGLMAVPPLLDTAEEVRPFFQQLRGLRDQARSLGLASPDFKDLSMGMSNDFEVAIEEGSTFIRVGTAIFGARS